MKRRKYLEAKERSGNTDMIAGDIEQAEVDPDDEVGLFEEVYKAKQQDLDALE